MPLDKLKTLFNKQDKKVDNPTLQALIENNDASSSSFSSRNTKEASLETFLENYNLSTDQQDKYISYITKNILTAQKEKNKNLEHYFKTQQTIFYQFVEAFKSKYLLKTDLNMTIKVSRELTAVRYSKVTDIDNLISSCIKRHNAFRAEIKDRIGFIDYGPTLSKVGLVSKDFQ